MPHNTRLFARHKRTSKVYDAPQTRRTLSPALSGGLTLPPLPTRRDMQTFPLSGLPPHSLTLTPLLQVSHRLVEIFFQGEL